MKTMRSSPLLAGLVRALLLGSLAVGTAHAEDKGDKAGKTDKTAKESAADTPTDDKSGTLFKWVVTKAGKATGEESVRVVNAATGNVFASGELVLKGAKKLHRKSHLQRDASGAVVKYQRVESGLKGAGLRVFEWKEQMRVAPVNAPGKPVDIGELPSGRIWDADLMHLVHLWGLPKTCVGARLPYYDPGKQRAGEAVLTCSGSRKVLDDKKKPIDVHILTATGLPVEGLELWVDGNGGLVGAKTAEREMLRAKYAEAGKEVAAPDADGGEGEDGKASIRERGVGE